MGQDSGPRRWACETQAASEGHTVSSDVTPVLHLTVSPGLGLDLCCHRADQMMSKRCSEKHAGRLLGSSAPYPVHTGQGPVMDEGSLLSSRPFSREEPPLLPLPLLVST